MKSIIKDAITNKVYEGVKCRCGSENIYVLHSANPKHPNDISADYVFCRCEDCRWSVTNNRWDEEPREFTSVKHAVEAWNKYMRGY